MGYIYIYECYLLVADGIHIYIMSVTYTFFFLEEKDDSHSSMHPSK